MNSSIEENVQSHKKEEDAQKAKMTFGPFEWFSIRKRWLAAWFDLSAWHSNNA